ncbi:CopG family transcriptional regulator [Pectobacterium zantedeschiae]|uniref:CopG family ribbon-helix-helix protein n=1 Tax=Pectobacterium zantedeschiae TaxID=2034769 RepID=UPI0037550C1D
MDVISVRLNDETTTQLDAQAKATGRTRSFLGGQAIKDYLVWEARQIAEIEQAIKEADVRDFVSSDEMNNLFKKLGTARHGN